MFCSTPNSFSASIIRISREIATKGSFVPISARRNVMKRHGRVREAISISSVSRGGSSARHLFEFRKLRKGRACTELAAFLDHPIQPAVDEKHRPLPRFAIAAVGFARGVTQATG